MRFGPWTILFIESVQWLEGVPLRVCDETPNFLYSMVPNWVHAQHCLPPKAPPIIITATSGHQRNEINQLSSFPGVYKSRDWVCILNKSSEGNRSWLPHWSLPCFPGEQD